MNENTDWYETNQIHDLHGIKKFLVAVVALVLAHQNVQLVNQF